MRRAAGRPSAASRGFEALGSVLDGVIRELRLEERFASAQATDHWSAVVGPEMAARTRCVGVRDRELLVEVRGSVWMGHLAVLRQGILERINERLAPDARLGSIRLVPMRGKEGRGRD